MAASALWLLSPATLYLTWNSLYYPLASLSGMQQRIVLIRAHWKIENLARLLTGSRWANQT